MIPLKRRQLLLLSVVPAIVYAMVFVPINGVLYPPPTYTLLVMLFATSALPSGLVVVAGAVFQSVVFCVGCSYLLIHYRSSRSVRRIWFPSLATFVGLAIYTAIAGPLSWRASAGYGGAHAAIVVNVIVAMVGVVGTAVAIRLSPQRGPLLVAIFNCFFLSALIAVLFPYFGELP